MSTNVTQERIAWSLAEISSATGLSKGFLRKEARRGTLTTRKFGRRVLVLNEDLKNYLNKGSETEKLTGDEDKE